MINYSKFNTTDNHSYNLYNAIKYCRENNEDTLVFDKGVYDFYPDMASEDVMCISNHDIYGIKRIAFLIKNMKDFTIDGQGSEFVFHGCIMPFAVKASENITLKNFSIDYEKTMMIDLKIENVSDDYFDAYVVNDDSYYVLGGELHFTDESGNDDKFHYFSIRSMGEDKSFIPEAFDEFKVFNQKIRFEDLGNKRLRAYNSELAVKKDMHLITSPTERHVCNIAVTESKNISLIGVTMYKSYAMGLLAQTTENVTIDKMTVKASENSLSSLNADATHFVNCRGLVKVTNSSFSEQQDDALNIHGIFTKITDKGENYIIVRFMHPQAKGINIYNAKDMLAVMEQDNLITYGEYEIEKAEVINLNYVKLYLKGDLSKIKVGDVTENVSGSCELIFENNRVVNNRARGILLAANGRLLIKNNYFNTPGVAILFSSSGSKWYESGATRNVSIKNNVFENCKYASSENWGYHVIEIKPRESVIEGRYYHKYISITENEFKSCEAPLLYSDNVERIEFKNNKIVNCTCEQESIYKNCKEIIN